MADFQVMGGVPDFYSQILNSARQQLVRQPDGTYAPAPQFGGSTSLDQIYGGILPPSVPSTPLVSRSVNTVPVDSNGNPVVPRVGNNIPSTRETLAEQRSGWRPAVTQGVQPALTATMPPGARPSNIPLPSMQPPTQTAQLPSPGPAFLPAGWGRQAFFNFAPPAGDLGGMSTALDTSGQIVRNRDPSTLAFSDPLPSSGANPALGAIDAATGAQPPGPFRSRPLTPYMTSPSYLTTPGPPVEITVNGGKQMPPMPRNRPAPPSPPIGGNYTVKRGDTVWDLARKNNTTVNAIALANGLRDPSKIRAGQQLTIPSVPAPRMRPPAMNKKPSGPPAGMTVDEVGALRYHG